MAAVEKGKVNKVLTIRSLSVVYGGTLALRDIDLDVSQGIVSVIGPNGAGKTTLLRAIAGLVPLSSGTIEILGRPAGEWQRRELARRLAVVPQRENVNFPMTVLETVLSGRAPHLGLVRFETERDLEIAHEAMKITGIDSLHDRHLGEISGGELQRVFIARALCQQPDILLLDEPTSALDPANQLMIMELMERLRRERGMSILMVSHDLNIAATYAQEFILLKDGIVIAKGSSQDVLRSDMLSTAYNCCIIVEEGPVRGTVRITPVSKRLLTDGYRHGNREGKWVCTS